MQLTYMFNDFEYSRSNTCWVNHLTPDAKKDFMDMFNSNPSLTAGWKDAHNNGYYPLRALLDKKKYPDGPQPCYPLGLDVRIPVK